MAMRRESAGRPRGWEAAAIKGGSLAAMLQRQMRRCHGDVDANIFPRSQARAWEAAAIFLQCEPVGGGGVEGEGGRSSPPLSSSSCVAKSRRRKNPQSLSPRYATQPAAAAASTLPFRLQQPLLRRQVLSTSLPSSPEKNRKPISNTTAATGNNGVIPEANKEDYVQVQAGDGGLHARVRDLPTGLFIQSADFTVGGHDWRILFYPSGSGSEEKEGYVCIFLKLMSEATDVSASFDFRLLDPTTGVSSSMHYGGHVFCTAHSFKKMSELKASYVLDDCLVVDPQYRFSYSLCSPQKEQKIHLQPLPPAAMAPASPRRPTRRTMSRSKHETEECTHVFEISQYSLHEFLDASVFTQSATFTVGGHDWCIMFYPSGSGSGRENEGYVSVFLKLMSEATTEVTASFDCRLLDPTTGVSSSVVHVAAVFRSEIPSLGFPQFKKKSEIEATYVQDDCLVVERWSSLPPDGLRVVKRWRRLPTLCWLAPLKLFLALVVFLSGVTGEYVEVVLLTCFERCEVAPSAYQPMGQEGGSGQGTPECEALCLYC
ncbi:hypothetical protein HU200_061149 [Digitaria exilis]|uniref:MATH domain-containing protein n=1 Tax=Digitaria exilis TaxID=1010633 RepID=A0A835DZM5_9POAL|nr:hypothetical protein HU200_061149 [Digitaria exilis]